MSMSDCNGEDPFFDDGCTDFTKSSNPDDELCVYYDGEKCDYPKPYDWKRRTE